MAKMKVSFVTTVLNEEKTIKALLDSLWRQTKKPDEIIIVDAGSTDKTTAIIKKHPLKPRLIVKKGINRSQGRNLGIEKAKHHILAVSDAGCQLDKNWLKRITAPFRNKSVDTIAGFYRAEVKTIFQQSLAPFVAVMPDKLDSTTFLPSSRSLAFRKSAWQKAGRYPENLNYCEDLIFAQNLKQKTNMIVEPKAIVHWQPAGNLKGFFSQIKNYASGDIQARYKPHLKRIITVYLRYFIFLFLPIFFVFYLFWPILKFYRYVSHPLAFFYLPLLQIATDIGIIIGSLKGLVLSSQNR